MNTHTHTQKGSTEAHSRVSRKCNTAWKFNKVNGFFGKVRKKK